MKTNKTNLYYEDIIVRALRKAMAGGYLRPDTPIECPTELPYFDRYVIKLWDEHVDIEHIILKKGFARAVWGEELIGKIPAWKYHLVHMVLADDSVEYLGEHMVESA